MEASQIDKQLNCVQSKLSSKSGKLRATKLFTMLLPSAKIGGLKQQLQPLSPFTLASHYVTQDSNCLSMAGVVNTAVRPGCHGSHSEHID